MKDNLWDENGINTITGTRFGVSGFDKDGYDKEGYNQLGYNRAGFNRKNHDKEGFGPDGYNDAGYDRKGFNRNGFDSQGYDQDGYDILGFNRAGYNREGFDKWGYDREGYDEIGLDLYGLDKTGKKVETEEEAHFIKRMKFMGVIDSVMALARHEMSMEDYLIKYRENDAETVEHSMYQDALPQEEMARLVRVHGPRMGLDQTKISDTVRNIYGLNKTRNLLEMPFDKERYLKETKLLVNGETITPTEEVVDKVENFLSTQGRIVSKGTMESTIKAVLTGQLDIDNPDKPKEDSLKTKQAELAKEKKESQTITDYQALSEKMKAEIAKKQQNKDIDK